VNRILANSGATLGIAVLGISLAIAGAGLAQTKSTKKTAPAGKDAAAVAPLARTLAAEESLRVKNRLVDGLLARGWAIPEDLREGVRDLGHWHGKKVRDPIENCGPVKSFGQQWMECNCGSIDAHRFSPMIIVYSKASGENVGPNWFLEVVHLRSLEMFLQNPKIQLRLLSRRKHGAVDQGPPIHIWNNGLEVDR